jgi:hypothetical protein
LCKLNSLDSLIVRGSFQKSDEKYAEIFNLTEANGEFNSTAVKKYIDDRINDEDWNKVLKENYDECTAKVSKSIDKIEKVMSSPPYNVNKSDCNIKLYRIFGCIFVANYDVNISAHSHSCRYFFPISFLEMSDETCC